MKSKKFTGGLVLTRKVGEAIYLKIKDFEGDLIRIDVRDISKTRVRVGIMADAELVEIKRAETLEEEKKDLIQ